MKNFILLSIISLAVLGSCNNNNTNSKSNSDDKKSEDMMNAPKEEIQDSTDYSLFDNSENSLDWNGTYAGKIPTKGGKTLNISIILNLDKTYTAKVEGDINAEFKGKFTWHSDWTKILLDGVKNIPAQYFVGENVLIVEGLKDTKGEPIKLDKIE